MKQYRRIKAQYPDCILFFRMGDFYELFYDDARIGAKVMGIALTSRTKGPNPIPMCGLPYHAVDSYLAKMVRAGYRVAICEQMEEAATAKGLVKRDVSRLVTPGTLTDDALLEDKENNYLAAVHLDGERAGLAWVDLSTGGFWVRDVATDAILDELLRLRPRECLVADDTREAAHDLVKTIRETTGAAITERSGFVFDRTEAERLLTAHFGTDSLDGFGISDLAAGVSAAGAVIDYLQDTQRTQLGHIRRIERVTGGRWLYLDETTQRSLELVRRSATAAASTASCGSSTGPRRRWAGGCCGGGSTSRWPGPTRYASAWTPLRNSSRSGTCAKTSRGASRIRPTSSGSSAASLPDAPGRATSSALAAPLPPCPPSRLA